MSRRRSGAVKQLKQLTSSGRGDVDLEKLAAKACKAMLSPRPADLETSSDSEEEEESSTTNLPEVLMLESEAKSKTPKGVDDIQLASSLNPGINLSQDIYLNLNGTSHLLNAQKRAGSDQELMKKSVLTPGFEKLHSVPAMYKSWRQLRKERKAVREQSLGDKWFGMPASELTDEMKRDLKVLKMRDSLDPKRFYKKTESSLNPKYIQVGTVVEGAAEFYSARIPKRKRKQTIVDELLSDKKFRQYSKRKVDNIQAAKPKGRRRVNKGKAGKALELKLQAEHRN